MPNKTIKNKFKTKDEAITFLLKNNNNDMTARERMLLLAKTQKIKIRDIANKLGIIPSAISLWGKQGHDIPSEYLNEIAKILGVSKTVLLTGKHATFLYDAEGEGEEMYLHIMNDPSEIPYRKYEKQMKTAFRKAVEGKNIEDVNVADIKIEAWQVLRTYYPNATEAARRVAHDRLNESAMDDWEFMKKEAIKKVA